LQIGGKKLQFPIWKMKQFQKEKEKRTIGKLEIKKGERLSIFLPFPSTLPFFINFPLFPCFGVIPLHFPAPPFSVGGQLPANYPPVAVEHPAGAGDASNYIEGEEGNYPYYRGDIEEEG